MTKSNPKYWWWWLLAFLLGCASQMHEVKVETPPPAPDLSQKQEIAIGPKHRIAIASFEDKSGYGSNLFGQIDDLGNQASDILASHLIKTGEFVVLEREKIGNIKSENELQGEKSQFGYVTALLLGSVTEFGTKTEVMDAGISKTKVQTAHAKVTIRMVNPRTGHAFYSEFGEADAKKEVSQTFGFGGTATYDATLTDKALNGAVTKLVGNILTTLNKLPWQAPILDIQEGQVFIGAGSRGGLQIGQILNVVKPGKTVKNPSTGVMMELPGTVVGKLKVVSQFGTTDLDEGSICSIIEGSGITTEYRVELVK